MSRWFVTKAKKLLPQSSVSDNAESRTSLGQEPFLNGVEGITKSP